MSVCKIFSTQAICVGTPQPHLKQGKSAAKHSRIFLSGEARLQTAQDNRGVAVAFSPAGRQQEIAKPDLRTDGAYWQETSTVNTSQGRHSAAFLSSSDTVFASVRNPFFVPRRMGLVRFRSRQRESPDVLTTAGPFPLRSGGNQSAPKRMSEALS